MAKKELWLTIGIIALIIVIGMFVQKSYNIFSITGQETMTRTAPTTVNPSSTFAVTYTAIGASGNWGATIIDQIAGGCQFPAGTKLSTVMLSDEGATKTIQVTAPASGTCTFTGDYQFGDKAIKTFTNLVVNICNPVCTRPADLCLATSPNGCGGTCTWTVTKKTNADANCNNIVDRNELGIYINKWADNQVTRAELASAIMAWSS